MREQITRACAEASVKFHQQNIINYTTLCFFAIITNKKLIAGPVFNDYGPTLFVASVGREADREEKHPSNFPA